MFLRRVSIPALAVLAALASSGASTAAQERVRIVARHHRSVRGTIDGFPFLVLRGDARERGRAHGLLAAREIVRFLDQALIPVIHATSPGSWEAGFAGRAKLFSWPERYDRELRGMLDGIREALPEVADRRLGSLGREIRLEDLQALNCLTDLLGGGCSSFSVWGPLTEDGRVLAGRNMDYMAFPIAPFQVLVGVEPAEEGLKATLDLLAFGYLGAGTAMNAEGVWAAMHDEPGLGSKAREGWVPRCLTLRTAVERARAARAVEDVAGALRESPVRVGNNIHLSFPVTASEAARPCVLEWDGHEKDGGVTVHAGEADHLLCTNHYRTRAVRERARDSKDRLERLRTGIEEFRASGRKIGLAEARELLEGVCRNGALVTHFSVVVWPDRRRMAFAWSPSPGRSSTQGRWITVEWADLFGM
jgi:hypothetical protein